MVISKDWQKLFASIDGLDPVYNLLTRMVSSTSDIDLIYVDPETQGSTYIPATRAGLWAFTNKLESFENWKNKAALGYRPIINCPHLEGKHSHLRFDSPLEDYQAYFEDFVTWYTEKIEGTDELVRPESITLFNLDKNGTDGTTLSDSVDLPPDVAVDFGGLTKSFFAVCQPTMGGLFLRDYWDIFKNQDVSFEEILASPNEEVKAIMLEFFNWSTIQDQLITLDSDHIDSRDFNGDSYVSAYTLLQYSSHKLFPNSNIHHVNILRCFDVSTDRIFHLQVPGDINKALDAAAWLCHLPHNLKEYMISISRQGERYSYELDPTRITPQKRDKLLQESKLEPCTADFYSTLIVKGYES